ncbi:uncharacterized protein LOC141620257 [Silene latifolia]|uniref:uncharacterized protein LOC141620257 n=1 Tax=Silene latifolia TaxID=37657 RepID=UPI003D77B114
MIYGEVDKQYKRVWDYAEIVIKYNVGSSVIVQLGKIKNPPAVFKRMYMCLDAYKKEFIAGCRPMLGVDGCHLKGPYPGQLLTALVEVENKDSWTWFLELLMKDIELVADKITFMSDRQNAEFEQHMEELKSMSVGAHAYLSAIPTKHWCRHAFSNKCKSAMMLNNCCESFNNALRKCRDKPVLSVMKWIRRYCMKRTYSKWEGVDKVKDNLMPAIEKQLKIIAKESRRCELIQCGLLEFEVVNLTRDRL